MSLGSEELRGAAVPADERGPGPLVGPLVEGPVEGPVEGMVAGPWRFPLLGLGWLCVGLGVLGFVVPLMPGTVFLLVALWAFSRSSLRFHNWLYHHRWLGPPLRAWDAHGAISRPAKITAVAMMAASLVYVTLFLAEGLLLPLALAAVMVPVVAFILSRPDRPGL